MGKNIRIVVLSMIIISGCSHNVDFKNSAPVITKNKTGNVEVYEIGQEINKQYTIVGKLVIEDAGLSESCGYEDALFLAREKTREIGADAIKVTDVRKPNFMSTCYGVKVDILEFK